LKLNIVERKNEIIKINIKIKKGLPAWMLMTFGSYALFTIGNQLNILEDFPEEHYKLLDDIKNAKAFMK
jgi:hypothetical protein